MQKNWSIDQLKHELSKRKEIKSWILTQEHVHRRERYFMSEKSKLVTDQDRNIHASQIALKIHVSLNKPGFQGEMTKRLFPALAMEKQISEMIDAARQTEHQEWKLPSTLPNNTPHIKTADPRMEEDIEGVMRNVTSRIENLVHVPRQTHFNSAELFLSVHNKELHLSNGLIHRSSQSRIYTEVAYSFAKKNATGKVDSDEYLTTYWAVELGQLPLETLFYETSKNAENSLNISKPLAGRYSVIIDAEVLSQLIHGHISQINASNAYHNLPFIKAGQDFIPHSKGDLLSIKLDPYLEFGAGSTAFSEQGVLQGPIQLVKDNTVLATLTDQQYSNYLGTPTTTTHGNVVVQPGSLTHQELTQQAPQVLEILQFSGLFTDPNSGTFSSEIRLGRLYNNKTGEITYVKGGSLSGSIIENFKGLKLSKSTIHRSFFSSERVEGQGYFGPDFAMLTDVSIVA